MSLERILTPELAEFLAGPPSDRAPYRGPDELSDVIDGWGARGADIVQLGYSRAGYPIRAAVIGDGARTLLAWGFPHPDEPLGSEALCWLGEGALTGALGGLEDWRLVLVLCPDPDEAARQSWFRSSRDMRAFTRGAWRPMKLGWMVDYGFPLDWGSFWQPWDFDGACRTRNECLLRCGADGCRLAGRPSGPLPESLALAEAIDRYAPDVVAAMHSTHSGGDYTFLLERESADVLADLTLIPGAAGTGRHLGEPLDRGRRWRRDAPDLIIERGLDWFDKNLRQQPFYDPELVYHMNHSAACYVQAQGRGAQFICPESTQFRHPDFSDTTLLGETEMVQVSVEDRRSGRYELLRVNIDGDWVVAHQARAAGRRLSAPREKLMPVTRGMLGVRALTRRRNALAAGDELWDAVRALDGLTYHPYEEERALISVPGRFVHDRSMLIFRTRSDYRREATRAQAASFRWAWPAQTAALLGNFQSYLDAQDPDLAGLAALRLNADALQDGELAMVDPRMRSESSRGAAMRSMLARVMRVMLARH